MHISAISLCGVGELGYLCRQSSVKSSPKRGVPQHSSLLASVAGESPRLRYAGGGNGEAGIAA